MGRRSAALSLLVGATASSSFATVDSAASVTTPVPRLNLTLPPDLPANFNISEYLLPTSPPPAIAAAPTSLEWARCDFTAITGSGVDRDDFDCASLAVPVCYADVAPCSQGTTRTHTLRALRRQTTNATGASDAPTVWLISESVDDANTAAMMERVTAGKAINVYAIQSRLWNPPGSDDDDNVRTPCAKLAVDVGARVEIDSTTIDAASACHAWLLRTFGTNATNAFSLDSAARDLATALQLVQTHDLKTTNDRANVYVLAMGQASRVVQRFMASTISNTISVAGYIFDTPYAMKLSPTYDETVGVSMGRFLDGCSSHVECSTKFANLSMSMRDVLAKLEVVVDGPGEQMSHCAVMLRNATFNEDRDLKPSHGVRRFFAALRRTVVGYKVAAPLLYRLQRCNGNDHYGVEMLLGAIRTQPSWSSREALAAFAERVITFSEFWPTPTPSRDALVGAFEKSLVSDGGMVAQQPSYCLYAASDAPECIALYKRNPQVNTTLKMTYAVPPSSSRSVNASTGLVGSVSADVLILTSRLSLVGSSSVAINLYDAFKGKRAILIETDSVTAVPELEGPAVDALTLVQVVGAFVTHQTAPHTGKWRAKDLSPSATDSSKAQSTYASPPQVALTFTISQGERSASAMLVESDLYEFVKRDASSSRRTFGPSYSSDANGTPYGYFALMVGGFLLVAVFSVWRNAKRGDAAFEERQWQRYQAPPSPPLHVNIMMPPTIAAQEFPSYGVAAPPPPPPPHAIPVRRPQLPPVPHPTAYPATASNAQALPSLAPATQWQREPVNEYAYSYTPVTDRPTMRTGL